MKSCKHAPPTSSNLKRKKKEDNGKEKKKKGRKVEKVTDVDIIESESLLENESDGQGFDNDSPRSNVVESVLQDSDNNDSGLIEGSEAEEDIGFSYSDEEDIRTNGGATSKDSVDLRKKKEDNGKEKKKKGRKVEKVTDVDIIESESLLENESDGQGFDDDSPRSNVVESVLQDSDDNDSGLIEGSEAEEDIGFSYSDEEDIRTNGGATSKDSVDLRFVKLNISLFCDKKVLI
ncbi:hypothetical protein RYX36_000774 [Vicia faba]